MKGESHVIYESEWHAYMKAYEMIRLKKRVTYACNALMKGICMWCIYEIWICIIESMCDMSICTYIVYVCDVYT